VNDHGTSGVVGWVFASGPQLLSAEFRIESEGFPLVCKGCSAGYYAAFQISIYD
jgi:hypothetical protein